MPRVSATSMKISGSSGKRRMEERVAAAIDCEPTAQVAPALDLMDGFVFDQRSSTSADVRQSIRWSVRKPRLNHERSRCVKVGVDAPPLR